MFEQRILPIVWVGRTAFVPVHNTVLDEHDHVEITDTANDAGSLDTLVRELPGLLLFDVELFGSGPISSIYDDAQRYRDDVARYLAVGDGVLGEGGLDESSDLFRSTYLPRAVDHAVDLILGSAIRTLANGAYAVPGMAESIEPCEDRVSLTYLDCEDLRDEYYEDLSTRRERLPLSWTDTRLVAGSSARPVSDSVMVERLGLVRSYDDLGPVPNELYLPERVEER